MQTDTHDAPIGMILAAGFGTRMRPLTEALPKPLIPFLNTPIIAYTLDHLIRAGVRHVGVNTHHLGHLIRPAVEAIAEALRPATGDLRLTFVHEEAIRGTAGGVAGLWRAMGCPAQTTIAVNGDALAGLDLRAALADHRACGAAASLIARPTDGAHPGGLWADAEGRVVGLRGEGDRSGAELDFMGFHLIEPRLMPAVLRAADAQASACMVADVYTALLGTEDAPVAHVDERFWIAVDTPALLMKATRAVLDDPSIFPQAPLSPGGLTLANPGAIDDKALFAQPAFVGALASVGPRARVGPYAVVDGTALAPGAVVERAILFGMGSVEGTWRDCVAINGKIAPL